MLQKSPAAGASPQTPLGSSQRFPRPLAVFRGKGPQEREGRERGEGKGIGWGQRDFLHCFRGDRRPCREQLVRETNRKSHSYSGDE